MCAQKGNYRPIIILHEDLMDNKFVQDYYNGISEKEAIKRVKTIIDN